MNPNREFYPVTEEGRRAYEDTLRERARIEAELPDVRFDADGHPKIVRPAEVIVMPRIVRGDVDPRVRLSVVLENMERQYGWELLAERFALLAETKQ
jgi:hypothetical protein